MLFGVSYGTKVAEDYAAAYPQNVEALVLDSVVLPEGPDPFQRSTLTTAPRVLQRPLRGQRVQRRDRQRHARPVVAGLQAAQEVA